MIIHTKTLDNCIEVVDHNINYLGILWSTGSRDVSGSMWVFHKELTCIRVINKFMVYSHYAYYLNNFGRHHILSIEEFRIIKIKKLLQKFI